MTAVDGTWTRSEMETFLEESLIPLRLGCHHADGGLWLVTLWYRYREGRFECATASGSDLAAFLRADDEVTFEVSTNRPPYMGVRGNGSVTIEPDEDKECLRSLVGRYLGSTENDLAAMLLDEGREELLLGIEPSRLYTWDFSQQMGAAARESPARDRAEPESPRRR
jgi:hypothetical protein